MFFHRHRFCLFYIVVISVCLFYFNVYFSVDFNFLSTLSLFRKVLLSVSERALYFLGALKSVTTAVLTIITS